MCEEKEPLGFLFKKIHDNIDRHANNNLKRSGLTFSQLRLLTCVARREADPPSQKQIGEQLQVSHPTVAGLLRRMEAKGMVRCGFDSQDRRVKSVYLTDEGRGYLEGVRRHRAQIEQRLTLGMTQAEADALRTLLKKVLQNVSDE